MTLNANFVFSLFVGVVLLAKACSAIQLRPEHCKKGQYWSTQSVIDEGACLKCPRFLSTCYQQAIHNQKRCVDSCRNSGSSATPEIKKTTERPSTSFTNPQPTANVISTIPPVFPSRVVHGGEVNKDLQPDGGGSDGKNITIWIVLSVLIVAALVAVVMVVVYLKLRRSRRNNAVQELEALPQAAHHASQAPFSTRTGGIQDTEDTNYSSVLNLQEQHN